MKVKDVLDIIEGKVLCCEDNLENQVEDVTISDMLSFVMSHGKKNSIIVTILNNINVLAVGVLIEACCIIIPSGIEVPSNLIEKAIEENIPIISTSLSGYEVCGKIYSVRSTEK